MTKQSYITAKTITKYELKALDMYSSNSWIHLTHASEWRN